MLKITIPQGEQYDPVNNEFVYIPEQKLTLEHSLISIAKWESIWEVPFIDKKDFTTEQFVDYIRCMTVTPNVSDNVYTNLTQSNVDEISKYISKKMTATTFHSSSKSGKKEIITAELIYYWMVAYNIPFECQKWHINKLLTLIRICSIKNTPPKKVGKHEAMSRNKSLNAARKAKMHTSG